MEGVGYFNFSRAIWWRASLIVFLLIVLGSAELSADESLGPEATLRLIVEANATRDLDTLSAYMSHDGLC